MTIELLDKNALLEQSITHIGQALRRGETSSVQLTQTALARARQVEPQINAFIELREEQALEQADVLAILVKHRQFLAAPVQGKLRAAGALDFCGALRG